MNISIDHQKAVSRLLKTEDKEIIVRTIQGPTVTDVNYLVKNIISEIQNQTVFGKNFADKFSSQGLLVVPEIFVIDYHWQFQKISALCTCCDGPTGSGYALGSRYLCLNCHDEMTQD